MSPRRTISCLIVLIALLLVAPLPVIARPGSSAADRLQTAIDAITELSDGPPGAIVIVQRGSRLEVFRAGVSNVSSGAPMRPWRHMRIASTAKAYSGGTALSLVEAGMLSLDDTIAELLPWAPEAWGAVTLGQALHHTSGLPDFSASSAFLDYVVAHLEDPVGPRRLLGFVADQNLEFDPGTEYRYSNSDNVVVALMAQTVTGVRYERLLRQRVYRPLGLHDTSLPRGVEMPTPYMRGYDVENDTVEDVSELFAAGYSWASGGIVSTPLEQNRFIRGYVGRALFGADTQLEQFDFIEGGRSEPTGPGRNAAGLAIFRYRTPCGTMFGHTGNTPGYTQFFAASRDGSRSVVVSVNRQTTPKVRPDIFRELREVYALAVCVANTGA
ncbi:MAG: serine hydrolase domain-containing protein [Actinomycetota bacterium]